MNQAEQLILDYLKQELEFSCDQGSHRQWVMALAVDQHTEECYTARVVVKTNSSPYVDGTDYHLTVKDEQVIQEADDRDSDPLFHGGPLESSLEWMRELGKPCYLQLMGPETLTKKPGKGGKSDDNAKSMQSQNKSIT